MSLWRRVFEERRQVMLPLLVLLVGNLVVLAFAVLPMRQAVSSATDAARAAQDGLEAARQAHEDAKVARSRKEEADTELRRFYTQILPRTAADASGLTDFWLHSQARRSNLEFQTGQYKLEPIRDSRLTKMSGKVLLRGTYANITRFLYDIETAEEFVVVEKVELGESGAVEASSSGVIEIALDVATYFVTPAARGGQGGE